MKVNRKEEKSEKGQSLLCYCTTGLRQLGQDDRKGDGREAHWRLEV